MTASYDNNETKAASDVSAASPTENGMLSAGSSLDLVQQHVASISGDSHERIDRSQLSADKAVAFGGAQP